MHATKKVGRVRVQRHAMHDWRLAPGSPTFTTSTHTTHYHMCSQQQGHTCQCAYPDTGKTHRSLVQSVRARTQSIPPPTKQQCAIGCSQYRLAWRQTGASKHSSNAEVPQRLPAWRCILHTHVQLQKHGQISSYFLHAQAGNWTFHSSVVGMDQM